MQRAKLHNFAHYFGHGRSVGEITLGFYKRWVVRELSNVKNGSYLVSISQSVSQSATMISARDDGTSEEKTEKDER